MCLFWDVAIHFRSCLFANIAVECICSIEIETLLRSNNVVTSPLPDMLVLNIMPYLAAHMHVNDLDDTSMCFSLDCSFPPF
jgi:hypothetical protein